MLGETLPESESTQIRQVAACLIIRSGVGLEVRTLTFPAVTVGISRGNHNRVVQGRELDDNAFFFFVTYSMSLICIVQLEGHDVWSRGAAVASFLMRMRLNKLRKGRLCEESTAMQSFIGLATSIAARWRSLFVSLRSSECVPVGCAAKPHSNAPPVSKQMLWRSDAWHSISAR